LVIRERRSTISPQPALGNGSVKHISADEPAAAVTHHRRVLERAVTVEFHSAALTFGIERVPTYCARCGLAETFFAR